MENRAKNDAPLKKAGFLSGLQYWRGLPENGAGKGAAQSRALGSLFFVFREKLGREADGQPQKIYITLKSERHHGKACPNPGDGHFEQKKKDANASYQLVRWRCHPDSDRGIKVLQTFALPLGDGTNLER